jgi:RHS repeat-associated protein
VTSLLHIRRKFTGKERDAESGLDYFGARYYASSMGRWMSPDWAAKAMPVPYASLDDPQSLNLYEYVGNNPLSQADPDGHCCERLKQFARSVGVGAAKYLYNSAATNPLIPASAKEGGLGMDIAGNQTLATPNGVGENIGYYGTPVAMAAAGIVTDAAFGGSVSVTAVEAPAVEVQSVSSPSFISMPSGDVVPVPEGATGPTPVVNGSGNTTGFQYQGGSGGNGMDAKTTGVRVMDPTPARGASPGYPNGNASYNNTSGQTVNPQSGQTVPRSDPSAHIPLKPQP